MDNISLLRSFNPIYDYHPQVETGGYKYFAPTERDAEALMSETERARFPDPFDKLRASLTLGRSTFKRAVRRGGRIWERSRGNYYDLLNGKSSN